MQTIRSRSRFLALALILPWPAVAAAADDSHRFGPAVLPTPTLTFARSEPGPQQSQPARTEPKATPRTEEKRTEVTTTTTEMTYVEPSDYRGVSSYFNIREANPDVMCGEWGLETQFEWVTRSDGTDDDVAPSTALKFGVTDDMFLQLKVLPIDLGDGDNQGAGDLSLMIFNRFLRESGACPAIAGWAELRIPSGEGSAGVDGIFHATVTKSLNECTRIHLDGFVETANGDGRGGMLEYEGRRAMDDRRHFQWGVGPGFDYKINECALVLMNYLHRSSEAYGHHNQNILEFGTVYKINECNSLKGIVDVGLDGAQETPNFVAKLLWEVKWK